MQFANCTRAISSTQLDLVGLADPPIPKSLADRLRAFDEVVSWYGSNRPDFREVMPRWTFLKALPGDDCQEHASDFFLQQVGGRTGTLPRIEIRRIDIPPVPSRQTIVIHPFSGSPSKNWPFDRYRQLEKQLAIPVEWTAGPDERLERATRFDSLLDLARWIRGASAYVGNDSGISHLAAAVGIPSVILFGPTNPSVWAPRGRDVTILRDASLKDLTVEAVVRTVLQTAGTQDNSL